MKIVYIAHCIGGDVAANLADLRRIVREINLTRPDVVPLVPYYADIVSLDDHSPEERERGIANDMAVIRSGIIQEMWLTGPKLSPGMRAERQLAADMRIPVVDMIGQFSGHDVPHDEPKAPTYTKHTGDWLGALTAAIPYLETLEADNIHDPSVGLRRDQELTDVLQDAKDIVAAAEAVRRLEDNTPRTFAQELTSLVNRYSQEADSDTPDFILAAYLVNGLVAFNNAVKAREQWYGREVLGRKPFPPGGVVQTGDGRTHTTKRDIEEGGEAVVNPRRDAQEGSNAG